MKKNAKKEEPQKPREFTVGDLREKLMGIPRDRRIYINDGYGSDIQVWAASLTENEDIYLFT